jgi:AAA domain
MAGTPLKDSVQALSVLYWGAEGMGKTTHALRATVAAAAKDGGRILLIDAEAGAKIGALKRQGVDTSLIDFWPSSPGDLSFEGLEALVKEVKSELYDDPKAYFAAVVDSFTEVTRRVTDEAASDGRAKAAAKGVHRDRFQVDLADYGTTSQTMRWLLRELRDLGIHLVITALERRDTDDDGRVSYGPAVGPAVATDVLGLVDIVGWCTVDTVGEETFRIGVFAPQGRRRAKDRYGILPVRMVDPTFDRIQAYVEGDMTKETDPARARLLAAMTATGDGDAPVPAEGHPKVTKAAAAVAEAVADTLPLGAAGDPDDGDVGTADGDDVDPMPVPSGEEAAPRSRRSRASTNA